MRWNEVVAEAYAKEIQALKDQLLRATAEANGQKQLLSYNPKISYSNQVG